MKNKASLDYTIKFHETDMAGIVHFSNYYKWMEMVEDLFLEQLGFKKVEEDKTHFRGWPRVHASCDFKAPLRYGETVTLELEVLEVKNHSLVHQITFKKQDQVVAIGKLVAVYAKFPKEDRTKIEACLLPEALIEQIQQPA